MANTNLSAAEQNALSVVYEVLGTKVVLDLDFVKKYLVRGVADKVSDQEVLFFMNTCRMQKLNPLVSGEAYLIKFGDDPAQMVVGKTAYLRRANEHPDYLCKEDGITVLRGNDVYQKEGCCLYPNETLIGGWCKVHYMRNGKERIAYKEVALAEYNKGQANWKTKPSTMINKVAISQCVREAFPKDYEGVYSEDEMIASGAIPADVVINPGEQTDTDPAATNDQIQAFMAAISDSFENRDDKNRVYFQILSELGLKDKSELTNSTFGKAMEILRRIVDSGESSDKDSDSE